MNILSLVLAGGIVGGGVHGLWPQLSPRNPEPEPLPPVTLITEDEYTNTASWVLVYEIRLNRDTIRGFKSGLTHQQCLKLLNWRETCIGPNGEEEQRE